MNKRVKLCLALFLAFAVIVQYSFSPQVMIAYGGEGDTVTATEASDQTEPTQATTAPKPAPEPSTSSDSSGSSGSSDSSASSDSSDATEPTESTEPSDVSDGSGDDANTDAEDPTTVEEETVVDEEALEEEEEEYPAVSFTRSANGVTVNIHAPEGALPEGATVKVTAVSASRIQNAVEKLIDDSEVVKAVDITFHNKDGKEIEPKKNVSVSMSSSAFKGLDSPSVVHIKDSGAAERVGGSSVSGSKATFKSDDFSIYAVVTTGDDARLKVIFKNGDSEIASTIVKKSDISATTEGGGNLFDQLVYDPGAGTLTGGQVFRGWTTKEDYTKADIESGLDIDGVRTAVKAKLNDGVTETDGNPETMVFYAMIFKAVNITYKDEDGVVIKNVAELTKEDAVVTHEINEPYIPKTSDQEFQGWYFTTQGTITDADGNAIAAGSMIPNETTVKISSDLILSVNAPKGYWLIFKENGKGASYTSPQFLEGENPTVPTNPTRFGYSFEGWYSNPEGTGQPFNFDQVLTQTTTVYAKWKENETAGYTVIIWKQNVNDAKNAADDAKTYDFAESVSLTGNVGETVDTVTANGTGDNRYAIVNNAAKRYTGFHLNKYDTNVEINTNGTAVVNVYYDRNLITLTFQYRSGNSWATQTTMTGLYGQTLAQNDYTWPTNRWWYDDYDYDYWNGYYGTGTRTTFQDAFILSEGGSSKTFYGFAGNGNREIRFYKKDATGNTYTLANTVTTSTAGWGDPIPTFYVSDKYNGYKPVQYRVQNNNGNWGQWQNIGDKNPQTGYYAEITTNNAIDIRFDPLLYNILYMDGVYVDDDVNGNPVEGYSPRGELKVVENVPIDSNLSSYNKGGANYYEPKYAGFAFAGWYVDDQCKQPYTFTNMTEGITVYAKWVQVEYRVFLHPNVPTSDTSFSMGGQSTSFRVEYGGTVNKVTGVRDDYELVGWYTDEACTKVFNFDAFVLNDSTVTTPRTGSYTERNEYGVVIENVNKDAGRFWVTRELNLYAKWRSKLLGANGITVVYDAGDGTFSGGGTTYTDPLTYKDTAKSVATTASTPNGAKKEFDYWQILQYKNGEFVEAAGKTVLPGDSFEVLKAYTQQTENEGSTAENPSYTYTFKLKAVYKDIEDEVTTHITWYANNGSGNKKEVENLKMNDPVAIEPATLFSYDGFEFVGWARWPSTGAPTSPTDTSNLWLKYENGQFTQNGTAVTKIAADEKTPYHDLYAVWKEKEVTIKYEVASDSTNMGSVSPKSETVKARTGSAAGSTATPASDQYTIDYWTCDNGTEHVGDEALFKPSKNSSGVYEAHTYYAHFKDNKATVTVNHYLKGTDTKVATTTTEEATIGAPYTASAAASFTGEFAELSLTPVEIPAAITVSDDASENVIDVYYTIALTITAKTDSKTYDGQPLDGEFSISGERPTDTDTIKSKLGTAPSITNVADSPKEYSASTTGIPEYYTITNTPGTLTIEAKKVTITANNASRAYNGSALTESGFTASKLEDGDSHTFKVTMTSDSTITDVGTQPNVIATVDGVAVTTGTEKAVGNYLVTTADGTLEITALNVVVTVTGNNGSKVYNGSEQSVTGYKVSADSNIYKASDLNFSGTAEAKGKTVGGGSMADGSYPMGLTPEQFSNGNDNFNVIAIKVNDGFLTITPATLTITAVDKSKLLGEADPTFTATVEGLISGEEGPEYSVTCSHPEAAGQYPIVVSLSDVSSSSLSAKATQKWGNYNVVLKNGTFTIVDAPIPTPTPTPDDNPGGGNAVATVLPAAAPTQVVADEPAPTTIDEPAPPKAVNAYWALINLLCAIATALLSLIMLIRYFGKRRDEEELADPATGEMVTRDVEEQRGGLARIASLIPAIGGIIAFILTEDMSLPMAMVDKWTVLMIVILAIQAGVGIVAKLRDEKDDEDEEAMA